MWSRQSRPKPGTLEQESVAQSAMLEPEDVAAAVVLACTQAPGSRIIEIQMRPMGEPLA